MKNFIKAIDDLPWIVKLILSLPVVDIIWAVYRIVKGIDEKNILKIIVGIVWIPLGAIAIWLVDLVCTIIWKKPILFA